MKSLSISNRINTGFALQNVLLMFVIVFAYLGVDALGDSYERYRATAKQTIVINDFVEDLFEARIAAIKYRTSPTDEIKDTVNSNIDEIFRDAEALATASEDGVGPMQMQEITALANRYRDDFLTMTEAQQAVFEIRDIMLEQGREARVDLTELGVTAVTNDDVLLLSYQSRAQESLLLGRIYALNFVATEDPAAFDEAAMHLEMAKALLVEAATQIESEGIADWERPAQQLVGDAQEKLIAFGTRLEALRTNISEAARLRDGTLDQIGPQMQHQLEEWAEAVVAEQDRLGPQGQAVVDRTLWLTPLIGGLAFVFALLAAFVVGRWITLPVRRLAQTTSELAQGNTDITITGAADKHELGHMAQALEVFREAHIERDRIIKERAAEARAEQQAVVLVLSNGLQSLAAGHLDVRVNDQLSEEYEALRENFNSALSQLENTISGVIAASGKIEGSAGDLNSASQDLSRRTENQAATLEETAAALDELTVSVKSSADRAKEVATTVGTTRSEAKDSGDVVSRAVDAMGKIEQSSQQISQITEVISDISFQTNLLALNAGVEAARAGDAGRGFAVVASEVRALAQRSSQAAREVSELISTSSSHVAEGTKLVNNAGEALGTFVDKVDHISDLVASIASNASEQATGISEINVGVNQLDQVTQQNAGMVETSHAQGQQMVDQAQKLKQLVSGFRLSGDRAKVVVTPAPSNVVRIDQPPPRPALPAPPPRSVAVGDADAWEDF